jgi:hypothetical protein
MTKQMPMCLMHYRESTLGRFQAFCARYNSDSGQVWRVYGGGCRDFQIGGIVRRSSVSQT